MNKSELRRNIIEAMIKLRRNALNLKRFGIEENVEIRFNNTDFISFDTTKDVWKLDSAEITIAEWNPQLLELEKRIINKYRDFEILIAIQNMDDFYGEKLLEVSALTLEAKFQEILGLMKLEENSDDIAQISFKDLKGNKISIYWVPENGNFDYITELKDSNDEPIVLELDEVNAVNMLTNTSYKELFDGLNNCYASLTRKK